MTPTFSVERRATLDDTPLSVFERITIQLKQSEATKIIPLHQGKTAFTTAVELREWSPREFDYPHYHDGPTIGTEQLLRAIQEKLEAQHGQAIDPARIQVTCGITHALSIVFHCILQPADEVLILSPHWLFVDGLVRAAGGVPIEVPFFPTARDLRFPTVVERVAPRITSRTRAIYFNSPNNPTGGAITAQQLADVIRLARERGLWLVSDNAYEYYDYSAAGFIDPAFVEAACTNTFAAYSFSKSYGLTGYRIGYLLSPPDMAVRARKFGLYSIYSVPTCCQFVALSALKLGPAAIESHRRFIRQALKIVTQQLRVPATVPDGGFYTLLDLSEWPEGVDDFITQCISEGVSLVPGHAFGRHYANHARLCYSVVTHAELAEGIRVINHVFDRRARR